MKPEQVREKLRGHITHYGGEEQVAIDKRMHSTGARLVVTFPFEVVAEALKDAEGGTDVDLIEHVRDKSRRGLLQRNENAPVTPPVPETPGDPNPPGGRPS